MMNAPAILAPATAAPPARAPVVPHDFSDRLSPILVKELRQGLRQPAFIAAFIGLQVLLCIVVVVAALGAFGSSRSALAAGSAVSGFFFTLLGLALLVGQPLRGLNALAGEIRNDTLDLLMLTRLTAWRVTFGKWLALVSQSALLVVAVLPYLILRYYLGGMQLGSELMGLAFMFLISASLTAMMVGFSATTSMILRGVVGLGYVAGLISLIFGILPMMFLRAMGRSLILRAFDFSVMGSDAWRNLAMFVLALVFFGYYLLEMGATQIAPAAENRSTHKRLIGIAFLVVCLVLPPDGGAGSGVYVLAASLLIVDALTERPEFTASVLRPFRKLGPLGWVAGGFLLPGWPSGVVYTGLVTVASVVLAGTGFFGEESARVMPPTLVWLAVLIMPGAVRALFLQRMKSPLAAYVLALLASLVLGALLMIMAGVTDSESSVVIAFPVAPIVGTMGIDKDHLETVFVFAGLTVGGDWLVMFRKCLPWRRRTAALVRQLEEAKKAADDPA